MLPTSTSNKSYTQQKRNPPGRKPPVARSSSLLGTIKNIVTAPLAWFVHDDDFEDTKGKRRRLGQNGDAGPATEDGSSRNKRKRVDSPERDDQLGYLDPPGQIFQQPRSAPPGSGFAQLPSRPSYPAPMSRSTSVTTPSNNVQRMSRNNRHTVSPLRTSFTQADIISRTMSMDPPIRHSHSRDLTTTPSRDGNRYSMSVPRDISMSPTRTPFRMRTSLTPQPSGSKFGPSLQQHREHASEPPSLEELMANPMFVRPPPEPSHQRNLSKEPVITLGSLVDSQRSTRSPSRPHSSLLFGPQGSISDASSSARPVNAAEKALHELDIYKTPLLPSRLRGSTTIPDMFKPKPMRSHTPIFMRSAKDEIPKLGKGKGKKKEVNDTKPYAGEGGMKKLLARRRQEEEEEKRQERAEAMDDGRMEEEEEDAHPTRKSGRSYIVEPTIEKPASQPEKQQESVPAIPPIPKFDPTFDRAANNREQSSLRVGRTRTGRNHLSRPTQRPHNRFSAVYDEDDEDDQMLESADQIALEEAAKKVPVFQVPAGFSFAKDTQIQHDLTTAKEPPIAALPFSLTKAPATKGSGGPLASGFKEQDQPPKAAAFFGPPPASSAATQLPSISLTAPTPEPVKAALEPPPVSSGIPNFFANSAALNKAPSVAPAPSTGSGIPNFFASSPALATPTPVAPTTSLNVPNFFANSAALSKPVSVTPPPLSLGSAHTTPTQDAENPLWEGEKKEHAMGPEVTKSFDDLPKPASLFGAAPATISNTSVFGADSGMDKSIFGSSAPLAPVKEAQSVPAASVFAAPSLQPSESTTPAFSFGAPAKPTEPIQQLPTTKPSPPPGSTAQAPVEAERHPSLFGGATAPVFSGSASVDTESKSAFNFGQPTSGASTPVEAPKPLFGSESAGGFSFGQRPSSAPTAEAKSPSVNPFSFGAAPSTPPAGAEKKAPFVFGSTPVTAAPVGGSAFSFGPPSGSSNGTDVSHKPFSFGNAAAAPARPVTPKNEQEFRMEESPTRDMNLNGKVEVPKLALNTAFSFGTSASSPGGLLFGQNNQGQSGSAPFAFGNASASNPFAKPEVKAENKSPGFSEFGQNTPSSAFSFDQKPVEIARAPSSSGAFSFGQAPAAPVTTPSFAFGVAPINSNPFSQTASNAGSTPNSPSTFNQATPFAFASPTVPSNPFAFGSSQPASPANGNVSLPQASNTPGGGFAFGQTGGPAQSVSPFQAPPPALPPVGGASLFTIGSAPPSAPPSGGRAIKKLPTRRMGKR